ncbi:hypothetical protein [Methylomagnum ishizawai]|uniref:hypothetical protein n=1 Tax=Methylomagnum ishizawai TaxID=1760988 RepID=UPI001C342B80|nr:hypothetical protein [Methylomagnum ishizawai]BBL76320.1 hypothetical protein MishRS11D_34180 [Methylomagnum ishizawai]
MRQDREAEIVSAMLGLVFAILAVVSLTTRLGLYGLLLFLCAALAATGVLPGHYRSLKGAFQRG